MQRGFDEAFPKVDADKHGKTEDGERSADRVARLIPAMQRNAQRDSNDDASVGPLWP